MVLVDVRSGPSVVAGTKARHGTGHVQGSFRLVMPSGTVRGRLIRGFLANSFGQGVSSVIQLLSVPLYLHALGANALWRMARPKRDSGVLRHERHWRRHGSREQNDNASR
jgi:hypothetical protein